MTVPQYIRKASLLVGDRVTRGNNPSAAVAENTAVDLSELRFRFAVRRGDTQTPNTADIRVYNVSENTAQAIEKEFARVVLQCGYDGNFGIIFDGQIKQVRRGRESTTDTFIDITAADGDSAYNFAISAITLEAGSTPNDHIDALLSSMAKRGVGRGYIPDFAGNPLPRGKVLFGMTRDELRKVAANTSTNWSIQDGKINMVPLTAYIPGEVPVLTAQTGVIGLPEQTQNGIKLKTLLNPNLKIGQAVRLDNASIQRFRYNLAINQGAENLKSSRSNKINKDGMYYVMIADHVGDTRGQEWYTDLYCLAIDASVPTDFRERVRVNGQVGSIKRNG